MSAVETSGVSHVSRSGSSASTYSDDNGGEFTGRNSTLVRLSPARKAKRIRFYRNGDKFYKGIVMAVTPERYRSFDSLVADLTRALVDQVNLPNGVRGLYTMDGRKVGCLEDLEDGQCYVCSGQGETFKKVEYNPQNQKIKSCKPPTDSRPSSSKPPPIDSSVRPRLITLVRNGTRPRKVVRVLLNKRNAPSIDHAFSSITEVIKLDSGAVRKVFTLAGNQVNQLTDFFGSEDVFFVYGAERYSREDFDLDLEEYKAIQSCVQRTSNFRRVPWDPNSKSSQCLLDLNTQSNSRRLCGIPKMPNKSKVSKMKNTSSQENPIKAPTIINQKYKVGDIIGDGNFAVVRHCIDRTSEKEYALKIIDKTKCKGKEHMIESEVAILRKVRHSNIIRLISEYDSPNELYLVMELIKGGDLFDAIAKAIKFPENEACIMIQNLASALFYLHSHQIVHRDIKPENLLVEIDASGTKILKLADFGLAQKVTEPLYTVCGTPTYVSPEILSETGYGLKIDVWAAGVILYILLCGFPPFVSANNNQEELFDRILSGQYEFTSPYWDPISDSAKDLIAHMLQVQPELRFSAEDVLDHHWLAEAVGIEQLKVYNAVDYQPANPNQCPIISR